MQIIVLGAHRSGTSLVTRIINMMGAYFASEQSSIGFNDENPKGFWERKDVIACNDSLLAGWECSWSNLAPLLEQPEATPEQQNTIKNIVLEMDAHRPWVMKDPRLCATLPVWRPYLEIPVCVMVYRDPLEIARSLQIRNGFSLQYGLALWEAYTLSALNAASGLPTLFMHHADMLTDPVAATKALYDGLQAYKLQGLRLPSEEEILAFVEPKFYRSKVNNTDYAQFLNQQQMELFAYTKGEGGVLPASISAGAKEAMRDGEDAEKKSRELIENFTVITQLKDQLLQQNEHLSKENSHLQSRANHLASVWLEEKTALTQGSEAASLKNAQLEALVTDCISLQKSRRWQIGNTVVKTLNALRLRSDSVDIFKELAARRDVIRKG